MNKYNELKSIHTLSELDRIFDASDKRNHENIRDDYLECKNSIIQDNMSVPSELDRLIEEFMEPEPELPKICEKNSFVVTIIGPEEEEKQEEVQQELPKIKQSVKSKMKKQNIVTPIRNNKRLAKIKALEEINNQSSKKRKTIIKQVISNK